MATNVAIVFTGRDEGTRQLARQLQRDFSDLQTSGRRLTEVLGAIGATLSVGAIIAYGRAITGVMSQMQDLAETTGETVERVSMLAAEARISGVEINQVAAFANRLARGLANADDETKGVGAALQALGVDARDAGGRLKTSVQLMHEIARAMQEIEPGAGMQNIIATLGGRDAARMIPFLNDLAHSTERVARVTAEQAAQAEEAERAWRRFGVELDHVGTEMVGSVLPAATDIARALADLVSANRELVRTDLAEWARSGAIALAIVADALIGVGRLVHAIAGSFAVVEADARRALDQLEVGHREALRRRNEVLEAANRRWSELWTYNGRAVEESVRRSFDALKVGQQALDDFERNADAHDLRLRARRRIDFAVATPEEERRRAAEAERQRREIERRRKEFADYQREIHRSAEAAARAEQAYIEMDNALLDAEWEKYARGVARYNSEIDDLRKTLEDMAGITEEARRVTLTMALDDILRKDPGAYTPEQIDRIRKGIAGVRQEIKETGDEAGRLAVVFTSSFERLIEGGGSASDVFRALLQDITKLIVQITILEPLARNLQELFAGVRPGAGGGGMIDTLFRLFGTTIAGGAAGAAARSGATTINIANHIGATYGDAALTKALDDSSRATVAHIVELQRRGRLTLVG